jgi:hypothetical protein
MTITKQKKNQEYRVPRKSLEREICEYLHDSSIKCADFYSEGRGQNLWA